MTDHAGRVRGVAVVVVLALTACTAAPSGSGTPVPTGPLADVTLRPLPAADDITLTSAAQAELDLIAEMRADAGFAGLLGSNADAVIEALDEASREHGEKTLPEFASVLGLDLAASLEVAALRGAPGYGPPSVNAEWSGSLLGQTSGTITMVMGLMAQVVSLADESGSNTLTSTDHYTKTPSADTTEVIDITTTFRIQSGGGRISADVEIKSTDVISDTSGTELARLEGIGRGHIDVNACPDADGTADGEYSLAWEEEMSQPGQTGAGSSSSTTAPFTLWDGDDAHWTRIDTTMDLSRGAHGSDAPGGDWGVTASVPMTIPAGGTTVIGYDQATAQPSDASQDHLNRTVNGTFGSQQFLIEVAGEAETFWRSGKCIELKTNEESRDVDPDEQISLLVEAVHNFDGGKIEAPITAAFGGAKSLEPANTPVDPPATLDFTAGPKPGDTGTIDLKQTSRRGIGLKTITFKVGEATLVVTYDGNVDLGEGFRGSLVMSDVKLERTGDTYKGNGPVKVNGRTAVGSCSAPVNASVDATVTGTIDEGDPNLIRLKLLVPFEPSLVAQVTCNGVTMAVPIFTAVQLWGVPLSTPIAVPIDGSVSVPAMTGASGSTTITVEKVTP